MYKGFGYSFYTWQMSLSDYTDKPLCHNKKIVFLASLLDASECSHTVDGCNEYKITNAP